MRFLCAIVMPFSSAQNSSYTRDNFLPWRVSQLIARTHCSGHATGPTDRGHIDAMDSFAMTCAAASLSTCQSSWATENSQSLPRRDAYLTESGRHRSSVGNFSATFSTVVSLEYEAHKNALSPMSRLTWTMATQRLSCVVLLSNVVWFKRVSSVAGAAALLWAIMFSYISYWSSSNSSSNKSLPSLKTRGSSISGGSVAPLRKPYPSSMDIRLAWVRHKTWSARHTNTTDEGCIMGF
mmetsp:Transcript_67307/g.132763  ORF Transcript_67307/g.132763 Transcript_67307/m.132763 type:complete len:237 (-) Transcript_67307:26-736(-)